MDFSRESCKRGRGGRFYGHLNLLLVLLMSKWLLFFLFHFDAVALLPGPARFLPALFSQGTTSFEEELACRWLFFSPFPLHVSWYFVFSLRRSEVYGCVCLQALIVGCLWFYCFDVCVFFFVFKADLFLYAWAPFPSGRTVVVLVAKWD